jgi:hypothetical protein
VLPDLPADVATGVLGVPQRLGGRVSWLAAGTFLGAATAVLAPGPTGLDGVGVAGLAVALAVVTAGAVGTVEGPKRQAGRILTMLAVIAAGLLDVALLVARAGKMT